MILNHNKIAIVGYARTGKTRCSELFVDRQVFGTDFYTDDELDENMIPENGRWLIEGVSVLWMLRAGLKVDLVIRLEPKFDAESKHRAQRKAIDTVWKQWLAQKPDCRIMRVNEDVLEFMVEQERRQGPMASEVWNKYTDYMKQRVCSIVGSDWRKNSIG